MPEPTAPVSSGSQIDPKQQAQSSSSHQPASHQSHSSSSTTSSSQQQQQQQQQPAKHSPSPSPRPHYANIAHSAPIPVQPGGHSPRAPHSPSMAYHHPSSTSSSPVRLPRPQNTAELHQELEREQEGAVNRLLHMIRSASSGSLPPASPPQQPPIQPGMLGRTPSFGGGSISGSVTGDDGRRHSRQNSDASDLWMMGGGLGGRDEAAFYRTEAEMLARENEMLKRRIRELEEISAKGTTAAATAEKKGGDKK